MTLKILSINAHGLNSPYKRRALWSDAKKLKGDVVCLQESHFAEGKAPKCSHKHYPHMIMANSSEKKRGVFIAISQAVAFKLHDSISDPQGRYVAINCDINNITYTIINVYAPNKSQAKFLKSVQKKISSFSNGSVLWCGDFNSIMDPKLDTTAHKLVHSPYLKDFVHTHRLFDAWRCMNATERDFSFFSSAHRSYSRIDYFFLDLHLLQRVSTASIHTITWSDHAPISIEIQEEGRSRPAFLWRNNTYLLSQASSRESIKTLLSEYFHFNANSVTNPCTIWCAHKAVARGLLIQQASRARKQRTKAITETLSKIQSLDSQTKLNPTVSNTSALLDMTSVAF